MKRIVKIEGVGNVVFPDSMSDAEVSQAAGRLYDDATTSNVPQPVNGLKRPDASPPTPSKPGASKATPAEDTSDWRH